MIELVPAVCPKCGADLELPPDLKIGHCMYCGAKVIIEESKPDVHYYGTGTVENYMKLAERKYLELRKGQTSNWSELVEYCDKTLEIDADNTRARVLRLYADAVLCLGVSYPHNYMITFGFIGQFNDMRMAFSQLSKIYEQILSINPDDNFIKEKKKNVEDIINKIDNSRSLFFHIRNPLFSSKYELKPINLFIPID